MAQKRIYARDLASLVGKQVMVIDRKTDSTKQVWVLESDGNHVQTKFNHGWLSFSCTDDTDFEFYTDVYEPEIPHPLVEAVKEQGESTQQLSEEIEQTPGQIIDQALNSEE